MKVILDACCGARMCWFNKSHPSVVYSDIRVAPKGHIRLSANHSVVPDEIVDFREMPYPDKTFKLVLFDPPHMLKRSGIEGLMAKKYGSLDRKSWKDDITKGFTECWRVLDVYGTLIFKWSSSEVSLKEVLSVLPQDPLFGHTTNRKETTHWMTFMKLES